MEQDRSRRRAVLTVALILVGLCVLLMQMPPGGEAESTKQPRPTDPRTDPLDQARGREGPAGLGESYDGWGHVAERIELVPDQALLVVLNDLTDVPIHGAKVTCRSWLVGTSDGEGRVQIVADSLARGPVLVSCVGFQSSALSPEEDWQGAPRIVRLKPGLRCTVRILSSTFRHPLEAVRVSWVGVQSESGVRKMWGKDASRTFFTDSRGEVVVPGVSPNSTIHLVAAHGPDLLGEHSVAVEDQEVVDEWIVESGAAISCEPGPLEAGERVLVDFVQAGSYGAAHTLMGVFSPTGKATASIHLGTIAPGEYDIVAFRTLADGQTEVLFGPQKMTIAGETCLPLRQAADGLNGQRVTLVLSTQDRKEVGFGRMYAGNEIRRFQGDRTSVVLTDPSVMGDGYAITLEVPGYRPVLVEVDRGDREVNVVLVPEEPASVCCQVSAGAAHGEHSVSMTLSCLDWPEVPPVRLEGTAVDVAQGLSEVDFIPGAWKVAFRCELCGGQSLTMTLQPGRTHDIWLNGGEGEGARRVEVIDCGLGHKEALGGVDLCVQLSAMPASVELSGRWSLPLSVDWGFRLRVVGEAGSRPVVRSRILGLPDATVTRTGEDRFKVSRIPADWVSIEVGPSYFTAKVSHHSDVVVELGDGSVGLLELGAMESEYAWRLYARHGGVTRVCTDERTPTGERRIEVPQGEVLLVGRRQFYSIVWWGSSSELIGGGLSRMYGPNGNGVRETLSSEAGTYVVLADGAGQPDLSWTGQPVVLGRIRDAGGVLVCTSNDQVVAGVQRVGMQRISIGALSSLDGPGGR
jgi:hypothetical protein